MHLDDLTVGVWHGGLEWAELFPGAGPSRVTYAPLRQGAMCEGLVQASAPGVLFPGECLERLPSVMKKLAAL